MLDVNITPPKLKNIKKMINFNIELKGLDKGKRATIDKSKRVLMKCMFKMEELAIDYAPFDTGYLRNNITLFPEILASEYVLTSKAPYSADLEFGNTPRDVSFSDIEEWAKRKGIISGKKGGAFVKYVVEKIKTKGVNARPFLRPSLQQTRDFWLPQFKKEVFGE